MDQTTAKNCSFSIEKFSVLLHQMFWTHQSSGHHLAYFFLTFLFLHKKVLTTRRRQFMVVERSLFKKKAQLHDCTLFKQKKRKYEHILRGKTENFSENNNWEKRKTIFSNGFRKKWFLHKWAKIFCEKTIESRRRTIIPLQNLNFRFSNENWGRKP